MAINDWNGDGKKDLLDDLIEYDGYKRFTSTDDNNTSQKHTSYNSGGISTFGAIVITVLGMLVSGAICKSLNIESGFLIVVIWIGISLGLFFLYDFIRRQF